MSERREIYLDNAAITPIDSRVLADMTPYLGESFGNPSSLYRRGRKSRQVVETARADIAKILNCQPYEIIFTSGGTESDNLAILGIARNVKCQMSNIKSNPNNQTNKPTTNYQLPTTSVSRPHIITSQIEHHAVLNVFDQLETEGFDVTYLPVGPEGIVNPEDVKRAIRPETILVSIMYANNEIGTIQPVAEIGEILKQVQDDRLSGNIPNTKYLIHDTEKIVKIFFHTDACQAAGYVDLDVGKLGVDLLSFNGSKIYGPPGVGVLYKKKGVKIAPQLFGGGQEKGLRPGTENVAAIAGLSKALKIVQMVKDEENQRLTELRDFFINGLRSRIPKIRLNGHPENRLPGNVNVSILDVEGEAMLLMLDDKRICASTGSACTSGSLEPSHVLLAMGLSSEAAHGSLRFSLGRSTSKYDLVQVLDILPGIVDHLRQMSPLDLDEKAFFVS